MLNEIMYVVINKYKGTYLPNVSIRPITSIKVYKKLKQILSFVCIVPTTKRNLEIAYQIRESFKNYVRNIKKSICTDPANCCSDICEIILRFENT